MGLSLKTNPAFSPTVLSGEVKGPLAAEQGGLPIVAWPLMQLQRKSTESKKHAFVHLFCSFFHSFIPTFIQETGGGHLKKQYLLARCSFPPQHLYQL